MEERKTLLHVSASPHIRAKADTSTLMKTVLMALAPAAIFGVVNFGLYALLILALSVVSACFFEAAMDKILNKPASLRDYSAAVTGLLLGMNLPPTAPFWMPILGSFFAIVVVKMLFGGLGQNFMNPALGARCFLLISFAGKMCDFTVPSTAFLPVVDTVSGATPLAAVKAGEDINLLASFIGYTKGTIGETSAVLLLIGGIYLMVKKVIDWRIPIFYLGTFSIFILIFGGHGMDPASLPYYLACELCTGGIMLGAWFMATDYVTSPITPKGRIYFGVILGLLTGLFRLFGASAEGVSYAIIISNLLVPLIERVSVRKAFGRGGRAR